MEEKKNKKKEKIKPFFDFLSLQVVILSGVVGGKGYRKSMWFGVRWAPVHPSIHPSYFPSIYPRTRSFIHHLSSNLKAGRGHNTVGSWMPSALCLPDEGSEAICILGSGAGCVDPVGVGSSAPILSTGCPIHTAVPHVVCSCVFHPVWFELFQGPRLSRLQGFDFSEPQFP